MNEVQAPKSALGAMLRLLSTVLIVAGVLLFYFGPRYQATTTDAGLVIAYPFWVSMLFAVSGAAIAMSSLVSLFKNPQSDRGLKLLFGLGLPLGLVYLLPGMFLTKIIMTQQGLTIEDSRAWKNETTPIDYSTLKQVTISHEVDPDARRNTFADFVRFETANGVVQMKDFGFLLPEFVAELEKSAQQFGFTVKDRRKQ